MSEVTLHAPLAGLLVPLGAVPDPVFGEGMMGDGFAIDPIEGVLRAPAPGRILSIPASGHAVTMKLENGVDLLIHIGLETVALNGVGFEAVARAGDTVRTGDPLIRFDLDAVGLAARDLITPLVATSDGARVTLAAQTGLVAAGTPIGRVTGTVAAATVREAESRRETRVIDVTAPNGIHARPAARIVALLKPYAAEVTLYLGERSASARSTVALLALAAKRGDRIDAEAVGADADAALAALAAFATERFGDEASPAPTPAAPPRQREGGICAVPGLAIGHALTFRAPEIAVEHDGGGVEHERAALTEARHAVAAGLRGEIGEAHRALLEDPALIAAADTQIAAGRSAGFAWRQAIAEAAGVLRATGDALLIERVADLEDVARQVIARLSGAEPRAMSLPNDTILIAEDLLPSQFLALDRARLAGICTASGGPTAHVAILAAAAGVPMVVAAGPDVLAIADGETVILDADHGSIERAPDIDRLAAAAAAIAAARERRAAQAKAAQAPCVMADGTRIEIFANLGSVEDAAMAVSAGAEGCGLLRTEFLFLDRAAPPDEAEQRTLYARIAAALGERPLILRTLDIGGDKPVPYLPRIAEENPALGLRGIRLGLARPDLLDTQLRAAVSAIPGEQCRIMLPMIVDVAELAAIRARLAQALADTGRTAPVQLGVMIETPAAALLADQLAAEADFFSIGTNDLTQYVLACDRGNAAVSDKVDALHPAVLRLIGHAARAAAARGRWTGVCGGLAADPAAAALLIGLGITKLSAPPGMIPALKAAVRELSMPECVTLAERACAAASPHAVRALLAGAAA
ncbi:phosphoenolpyruvate--protein phosphotransferase [Sphingomonas jatrophae]|uniref:phosphoenolpyruvate--protein phosphotransferase n=1 Tax=Sphingomonas jatrophae TaxID=1166337 RepID=A0A1I6K9H1_9SPHN|nr:phosphoenolpyruvate--protein phosphotransferase [Sphingomonas jatrophae]SFR87678.1 Phosphocarrier protein HPr /phosphoenolpyruvate--protein phosphotransferase /PTS system IIA component, Glc family [Sphingomonas jatrophae]